MASPELVRIMNAAHKDPTEVEEVHISGFHVPWEKQEIPEEDLARMASPGCVVLDAPGHTQINANV
eukprot:5078757-Amphidinium_carterae.1